MRTEYHENLRQLAGLLRAMCVLGRSAVETATDALVNADLEQSERAMDIGLEVDLMRDECEREALRLLTLESPVAGELRQVVTAIQLAGNLHRMTGLATHVADIARRRHPEYAVPEPMRALLARMGAAAVDMAAGAAEVLESGDPDDAARLDSRDDLMDRLHEEMLTVVLGECWDHGTTAAVDLALLGRYYERFADHAVEVGRRTIFMTTGESAQDWSSAERGEP